MINVTLYTQHNNIRIQYKIQVKISTTTMVNKNFAVAFLHVNVCDNTYLLPTVPLKQYLPKSAIVV